MPRDRQMLLAFGETQSDKPIEPPRASRSVEEITASLRPRIVAYLHQAGKQVSIYELRSEMGYSGLNSVADPQSNPVNRILKEMRDAGEIVFHERDWGEPLFSLAQEERPSAVVTHDLDSKGVESLEQQRPALELTRPDRQFTFDGQPFYEWPKPTHDRDSITVDRVRDDIDGPAHRFLIRRGDIAAALLPERPGRSLHVPVLVAKIPRLENGYNESFNGTLRYELLDAELFDTLLEAKVLIERWRIEYNTIRPHSSLGYRPPAPEAIQPRTDSATRSLPREYLVKKGDTLALT